MGGEATSLTAGNQRAVDEHNLGVAVVMHPALKFVQPLIPTFFGSGELDRLAPAFSVERMYDST